MSFRARLTALFFGAAAPVRAIPRERVTSTVSDGWITPAHEKRLTDAGRKAVNDVLARTHVNRSEHFDVPRVGA